MNRITSLVLAAALALMTANGTHAGGKSTPPKTEPKPMSIKVDPCKPRPAPVTGGAFGQLERLNGIGPGAGHTGVGFDGRNNFGPRSGSDVFVKPAVNTQCRPQGTPSGSPVKPQPIKTTPRKTK